MAVLLLHSPHNVSNPDVQFTAPATTVSKPATSPTFEWPRYGYDAARTRDFSGGTSLDPPFRLGWTFDNYALVEFPPVIYGHTMYLMDDGGFAKAIDDLNGQRIWQTKVGTLAAASPALGVAQGLIFLPVLSTTKGAGPGAVGRGRFVALSMRTGKVVWSRTVAAGTESSPLAWGDAVYFGDQGGTVYSLDARTGHVNWTFRAAGAVKGGPALADGKIFFGDYAGRVYALNALTGHKAWAVSTGGADFGFGSGTFYSTPAVAFGRVYIGNTDGFVYSFAESNGQVGWATGTGAYVYASAAVADIPGIGPTVYVGSYSGRFYAFDARSGRIRWVHDAGGRISGSATVIGHDVYYSDLASKTTTGLDARNGHKVFSFPDGAFNPVIADDSDVYLVGYSKLYQLIPKNAPTSSTPAPKPRRSAAKPRRSAAKSAKKRK